MAILSRSELPGVAAEQIAPLIHSLREQMQSFPGFIAHASGAALGSYQVIEVWESQEAQDRWIREALMPILGPALQAMGVQPSMGQPLTLDQFITR